VLKPATILDDLRRRDFTANAMALSLNEGSFGLLMDPLNGVADIENRELRLVSNYGFIEDPIRMVRAARLMARLGWTMDEKTAARYETGKQEGYISAASKFQIGYEAEEIVHEEDPLRVLTRLETEGWMKILAPAWTAAKVNVAELERLRESQAQLQMQGIHPNTAAANFPLLTAKLSSKETTDLKASFPRPGFVREIEALEGEARDLAAQLTSKAAALPSQTWKLLHSAKPEAVLMVTHSSKSSAVQAKFKSFFTEWSQARQKVPYSLMQEMRIVPDLAVYETVVEAVAFELMDGKLGTVEEMKAFLEPFSPPAPPPTVHLRRPRAPKKDAKGKGRAKKAAETAPEEGGEDLLEVAAELIDAAEASGVPAAMPSADLDGDSEGDDEPVPPPVKTVPVKTPPAKVETAKVAPPAAPVAKKAHALVKKASAPAKAVAKPAVRAPSKAAPVKTSPAKSVAFVKKAAAAKKPVPAKKPAPKPVAKKAVVKTPAKKMVAKAAAKKAPAKVVARKSPAKLAGKPAAKPKRK